MSVGHKKYWDTKYMQYWKDRVAESGAGESAVVSGDAKTEDEGIYRQVFNSDPFHSGSVLDVGCAWGRLFPLLKEYSLNIVGVDISHPMMAAAVSDWQADDSIQCLAESCAEALPFADELFDNLVCIATFDATVQEESLAEFFRVTREGAKIYITGKHYHYLSEDNLAYDAECGARRNNHPNFFSDVSAIIESIELSGAKILSSYYFTQRGDFSRELYSKHAPSKYYEFFLVIERGQSVPIFSNIGYEYSKTFHNVQEKTNE